MRGPGRLPRWADLGLLPIVSLLAALAASAAIIALIGESPWEALRLLVAGAFGSPEAAGYTLYYATNFVFTGLAVAVAFHAGLFNIGCEGQAYVGGLGVGLACLGLDHHWPLWAILPVALCAAAGFGAAWAFIPAWLQARRGSHIVITTIMFNFIASALMTWLLVEVLIKPGQQSPESREFAAAAWLPTVRGLLGRSGRSLGASPLNLASGFALVAAVLVWIYLWRTRWGYALRVVGQNPTAAVYAGISPPRVMLAAMLISGALAGGLGLNEVMGVQHRLLLDFPGGAGYVGIAVALMGRNHPLGICLAALLFGALYQGGSQLSFDLPRINRDMVVVIQGLVILACGALENLFRVPLAALWARRRPAGAGE
ncbi:MAG TPA: ABC transporter permease [Opitutaceae bacterium]|nr:ABC transporter permease [Opitutaceae bacterium]